MQGMAKHRSAELVFSQGQRATVGPTGAARQRVERTVEQRKAGNGMTKHGNVCFLAVATG